MAETSVASLATLEASGFAIVFNFSDPMILDVFKSKPSLTGLEKLNWHTLGAGLLRSVNNVNRPISGRADFSSPESLMALVLVHGRDRIKMYIFIPFWL